MSSDITSGLHDMSAASYHADPCPQPSLSNGIVKELIQRTPRHAWLKHPRLNPQHKEEQSTKFDLGEAAHALLLEGRDNIVVVDADDWRTKSAQAARDAAYAEGQTPLLAAQYEAALSMVSAAQQFISTTALAGIFERGLPERSVLWNDDGIWCRARPDLLDVEHKICLDYKSTGADGPGEWMRRYMLQNGYDTQRAHYLQGLRTIGLGEFRFLFMVQETHAPYMCYLVECDGSMAELGEHKMVRARRMWRECLSQNLWPGYSTQVYQAPAPAWAIEQEESQA